MTHGPLRGQDPFQLPFRDSSLLKTGRETGEVFQLPFRDSGYLLPTARGGQASLSTPFSGFLRRLIGAHHAIHTCFQLPFRDSKPTAVQASAEAGAAFNSLFGIPTSGRGASSPSRNPFNSLFGIHGQGRVGHLPRRGAFNSLFGIQQALESLLLRGHRSFNSLFGILFKKFII